MIFFVPYSKAILLSDLTPWKFAATWAFISAKLSWIQRVGHGELFNIFSILSNLSQGGKAIKTTLSHKEINVSNQVAKVLKKNGIFFAGIDLVSGYLIGDINVTSPTGLPQFKELTGVNLAKNYWDELEKLK